MKIAIVYNRESQRVINLFGLPNREKYGLRAIKRILDALKEGGHQAIALEGDKDLVDRLEEFMPRVLKGERPGMVFNLSYGIQGQARYTHVPGMLEMVGIPYVGSGPLAHSLALDKVVAKMIFKQRGLPTPEFSVIQERESDLPEMTYPLIVKPKNESVSFGLQIVHSHDELRSAANAIFDAFDQPVLVEQYIEGREINVGLIGNRPAETFPPVELVFGDVGPKIYTMEDKKGKSGRQIGHLCPAPLDEETMARAQQIARGAFEALGCFDCARVDMRLDSEGHIYILEINSLPSLGEHGSYTIAAASVGLTFPKLINRLVEVASARYFGTPLSASAHELPKDPPRAVFEYLTERRDRMEQALGQWVEFGSRTNDVVGVEVCFRRFEEILLDMGLKPVRSLTRERTVRTYETPAGLDDGTLLVLHVDVPLRDDLVGQNFRREPELLHGEGIGVSRAPLVLCEYVLRALRAVRALRKARIGVLCYADEGMDARHSSEVIREAAGRAARVLVLRPGNPGEHVITGRRGQRRYRLRIEGKAARPKRTSKTPELLRWAFEKLEAISQLSSATKRISVSVMDLRTESFAMLMPHRVRAEIMVSHGTPETLPGLDARMREILGKSGFSWSLEVLSDRPPMDVTTLNEKLAEELGAVARKWELPLQGETSVWPSVAGLVPEGTPVVCGLAPIAEGIYTPAESIWRISLLQRTVLLALYLLDQNGS